MSDVFGNEKYFENTYQLQSILLNNYNAIKHKTIVVGWYNLFKKQSLGFLNQMKANGVEYVHDMNLHYEHRWKKEWIYGLLRHKHGITNKKSIIKKESWWCFRWCYFFQ